MAFQADDLRCFETGSSRMSNPPHLAALPEQRNLSPPADPPAGRLAAVPAGLVHACPSRTTSFHPFTLLEMKYRTSAQLLVMIVPASGVPTRPVHPCFPRRIAKDFDCWRHRHREMPLRNTALQCCCIGLRKRQLRLVVLWQNNCFSQNFTARSQHSKRD